MSTISPQVNTARFSLTASFPNLIGAATVATLIKDLGFSGITYMKEFSGSYTPANDSKVIYLPPDATVAPNFIYMLTDAHANLALGNINRQIAQVLPVYPLLVWSSVDNNTYPLNDIRLRGETSLPGIVDRIMAQGVAMNYYMLMIKASSIS